MVLMALLVLASLQVGGRERKRLCQHPPEVEEAGEQTDTKNETRRIPDPYHMHHDPPIFPHGEMLGHPEDRPGLTPYGSPLHLLRVLNVA